MEKRRKGAFHGDRARRRHGQRWRGARRRYLGSTVGTSASTTCRRARRTYWRTIAGRGGGEAANLTGGCGGAARGRVSELVAGGEERQRGRVKASAAAPAEVGGCVGAGAGRLRRAAASTAHGCHAAGLLCHGQDAARRVSGRARAVAGQARRWAGLARRAALAREARYCRPGRLSAVGQKRGDGPRNEGSLFQFIFSRNFQIPVFQISF